MLEKCKKMIHLLLIYQRKPLNSWKRIVMSNIAKKCLGIKMCQMCLLFIFGRDEQEKNVNIFKVITRILCFLNKDLYRNGPHYISLLRKCYKLCSLFAWNNNHYNLVSSSLRVASVRPFISALWETKSLWKIHFPHCKNFSW